MAALPLTNCFEENIERKSVPFSSKLNLVKLPFNFLDFFRMAKKYDVTFAHLSHPYRDFGLIFWW